jgi:hypothetical protein
MDKSNKILSLWKDKTFSGSFSGKKKFLAIKKVFIKHFLGLHTFQQALKFEKNIIVSIKDLKTILSQEENYLRHIPNR